MHNVAFALRQKIFGIAMMSGKFEEERYMACVGKIASKRMR